MTRRTLPPYVQVGDRVHRSDCRHVSAVARARGGGYRRGRAALQLLTAEQAGMVLRGPRAMPCRDCDPRPGRGG